MEIVVNRVIWYSSPSHAQFSLWTFIPGENENCWYFQMPTGVKVAAGVDLGCSDWKTFIPKFHWGGQQWQWHWKEKEEEKNLKKTKLGNFCDQRGIGKGKILQKKKWREQLWSEQKKLLEVEVEQQRNHGKIIILDISQNESIDVR